MRSLILALTLLFFLAEPASLLAEEIKQTPNCDATVGAASARPDASGQATVVRLGISVMDILKISDLNQSIELDLLVYISWIDPRLASLAGCTVSQENIWTPDLQLLNSAELRDLQGRKFKILDNGLVEGRMRFQGSITSPRYMGKFPFDEHRMKIAIASAQYPTEQLVLEHVPDKSLMREDLSIPDWTIGDMSIASTERSFEQLVETRSVMELTLAATRLPDYYLYKVILPLIMIVMMSWSVFWIDPENLESQLGLAGTSMLTLIAFQFSMGEVMPKFGYFTILDRFILTSSILVFLALVEAVVSGYLAAHSRLPLAGRLDKLSRWVFPSVYGALVIWVLVVR